MMGEYTNGRQMSDSLEMNVVAWLERCVLIFSIKRLEERIADST